MSDENELATFAQKISQCISTDEINRPLLLEHKKPKEAIHIPFIFPLSHLQKLTAKKSQRHISLDVKSKMRSFFFTCLTLNFASSSKGDHFLQAAEIAHLCCGRQDFHLLPFKKLLLEHALRFRRIVGWKVSEAILAKSRINSLACERPGSSSTGRHLVKVIPKGEGKGEKELSLAEPKEERHYRITRVVDLYTPMSDK